jgi:probable addiction module antidote protein
MEGRKKMINFDDDLMEKLRNKKFASLYIMSSIADNDLGFLPIALGDVARAFGISKLSKKSGINRRTLYKVFDDSGNPSFELVCKIISALGLNLKILPKSTKSRRTT